MRENNNNILKQKQNQSNSKNRINNRNSQNIRNYVSRRNNYTKGINNKTHEIDNNHPQIKINESQPILNILKMNNPNNTFYSSNKIEIKFRNKNIFDMPTINVDLDKNDSEDSKEEDKDRSNKSKNRNNQKTKIFRNKNISDINQNPKSTKLDKLADFINKLNDEDFPESERIDFNNYGNDNHDRHISEIKLPSENVKQKNEESHLFNKNECHIQKEDNNNENKTDSIINIFSNIENNNKNENNEDNNLEKKSNSLVFMSGSKNDNNNENKIGSNINKTDSILFISSNIEKNSNIKNDEISDSKNNDDNKSGSVIYIDSNFDKNINNLENKTESIMYQFTNRIKSENMNNILDKLSDPIVLDF
jgi:hypothetical protein